jgi:hypothetical protein
VWLVTHAVTAGSSVGERWYEFQAPQNSTSLSVYQQGTFAPDNNYRWMGSIAMDSAQDIALGYSVSSSSLYPSIRYTGRVPSDPLGTMETEAQIVAGTGSQTDTSYRWGDYSSMVIDEADDCTFWYTNQYYMAIASFDWSTQLASFKFNSCVPIPSGFSLSATPASQTVSQGSSTSYTATVTSLDGFNSAVSLTVSGCPSNTTCALSPASVTPPPNNSASSTLTVTTTSTTPLGTYTLTITGTSGSVVNTTSVTLVVTSGAPDFTLSAAPSSQTVAEGGSTSYTATVTSTNGFNSAVSLIVSGCPANTTCALSPTSVTPPANGSASSTLSVGTTSTTPAGTYTLTITGTSGSLVSSTSVTLIVTVPGNFTIAATPSSRTVAPGSSTTYKVTATPTGGFTGTVALSVTGLPASTTGTFSPKSVSLPPAGTSTLTVATGKTTPTGTYTLTITGTSGTLSQSTTVTLVVKNPVP